MVLRTAASAVVLPIISLLVPLCAQEAPAWRNPSSHQVQFVNVDNSVRLEVLDWGGTGRPLVLLAGLGFTAHVYDDFAVPRNLGPWWNTTEDPEVRRILALAQASKERVAKAFEEGGPGAHVVRMPNVSHDVFLTNERDVLREMNAFIAVLK